MILPFADPHMPHMTGKDRQWVRERRGHARSGLMQTSMWTYPTPAMRYWKGGGGGIIKSIVIGAVLGAVTGGIGFAAVGLGGTFASASLGIVANTMMSAVAGGAIMGAIGGALSGVAGMLLGAGEGAAAAYQASDNKITTRNSVAPRKKIYGSALAGGVMLYATSTGGTHEYMHMVTPIATHPVAAIREAYFNNNISTNSRFNGFYRISKHTGSQTQAADADLVSEAGGEWTSAHRLRETAYIYPRIKYDATAWVSGLPSTSVMVDGGLLYDPRATHATISASTQASPGVFTTTEAHGFAAGDIVFIRDHIGATYAAPNGLSKAITKRYTVNTVPSASAFTLLDDSGEPMPLLTGGAGGTVAKCAWSNNAALAILDYITSRDGINCKTSEVDWAYWEDAADICDEDVSLGNSQAFTASATSNALTLAAGTGWQTGTQVFVSSDGALPGGLSANTAYYWIRSDETTGQLAGSYANALAGTVIDLTTAGTGPHTIAVSINFAGSVSGDTIYLFSPKDSGKELWVDAAYMALNPDVLGASAGGTGTGWWGGGSVGNFKPSISAPRGYDHYMYCGKAEGRQGTWAANTYIETGDAVTLSGSLPGGLSGATTYYWFNTDYGAGKLATSRANAMAGIAVDITSSGGVCRLTRVSQARYTTNGIIDLSKKPIDILNELLTACGGVMVYTQGKYRLFPAAPAASVKTISERDLRGSIKILPHTSRMTLTNAVRGTYKEPVKYWEMTDFPPLTNATYEAEDGNQRLYRDVPLPHTIDSQRAQRIASIALGRARRGMVANFPATVKMLGISAWDCVELDLAVGANSIFAGKKFRVVSWVLAGNGQGIDLTLNEEDDASYAWAAGQGAVVPQNDLSSLPSPWDVTAPTNLTAVETVYTTGSGTALLSALTLTWDASEDSFVRQYSVSYKLSGATDWTPINPSRPDTTSAQILGLAPGTYDVRVQAISSMGAESAYLTLEGAEVVGTALLPALSAPQITSISESLITINGGQGVNSQATVAFSVPSNPEWAAIGVTNAYYQVEYSAVGANSWSGFDTPDVSPGLSIGAGGRYDWRVKAVTSLGLETPYSDTFTFELRGLTAPPADVSGFSVQSVNGLAYVQWGAPTDLDVKIGGFVRIRYSPLTTGATWNDGTNIGPQFPGTATHGMLPLLTGTYMVKAIDSSGNYSINMASMSVSAPTVQRFTGAVTVQEHPTFGGAKSNVALTDGGIQIDCPTAIDDFGLIDSVSLLDYAGGVASSGTYSFTNSYTDLGGVYTSRIVSSMTAAAFDTGDLVDSRYGLIDSWGTMDGDVINSTNAQLQISTTNDNPAGSPTWSAWAPFYIGDYSARAVRFRVVLSSGLPTNNVRVTGLGVDIQIPHATLDLGTGLAIPDTGRTFTYSSVSGGHAFYSAPTINVTPRDMATGDYYLISSASRTGFTIQFFNSSGVGVARSADISVSGFGQQAA